VLRALHRAADILHKRGMWQRHGHLLQQYPPRKQEQAPSAVADAEAPDGQQQQPAGDEGAEDVQAQQQQSEGEQGVGVQAVQQEQEQQQQQQQQDEAPQSDVLSPEVVELLQEASQITDAQVAAAQAVADDVEVGRGLAPCGLEF